METQGPRDVLRSIYGSPWSCMVCQDKEIIRSAFGKKMDKSRQKVGPNGLQEYHAYHARCLALIKNRGSCIKSTAQSSPNPTTQTILQPCVKFLFYFILTGHSLDNGSRSLSLLGAAWYEFRKCLGNILIAGLYDVVP